MRNTSLVDFMLRAFDNVDHRSRNLGAALVPTDAWTIAEFRMLDNANGERINEPFSRLESGTGSGILLATQSSAGIQSHENSRCRKNFIITGQCGCGLVIPVGKSDDRVLVINVEEVLVWVLGV